MNVRARDLIGRKIVAVDFRPFQSHPDTAPRQRATNPVITLDNGRRLSFVTLETEVGEYGVALALSQQLGRKAPK